METRRWHNSGEKKNISRDGNTVDKGRQAKENRQDGYWRVRYLYSRGIMPHYLDSDSICINIYNNC